MLNNADIEMQYHAYKEGEYDRSVARHEYISYTKTHCGNLKKTTI